MIYTAIIFLSMAILSMAAGGSLPGSKIFDKYNVKWLPELIFGMVIGFCAMRGYENIGLELPFLSSFGVWSVATAWSYIWMQTGHAAILPWDKVHKQATVSRDNTLTPAVHFICTVLGLRYMSGGKYTETYVWAFAAVKGFLIGLPVGGLALAVMWPLGYEIGSHARNHWAHKVSWDTHMVAEGMAGAGAGLACVLWIILTGFWG